MKNTLLVASILALVGSFSCPALAEQESAKGGETLTAIEVAALMEKGTSEADIARKLAEQRGVELSSPLLKGRNDEHIISYLLVRPRTTGITADKGQAARHRAEAEKYYGARQHDLAAREFTLAIDYAPQDFDLYRLRGDSYREYVAANLPPAPLGGRDGAGQTLAERKRRLLCSSIYSDYRTASRLVDKSVKDGLAEMNRLRDRMTELKGSSDPNTQYKKKSAENILSMRLMQRILYQQRAAKQSANEIRKAVAGYKEVCSGEDAERISRVRQERDRARDRKWVRYGEKDEATYFYDKSNLQKSKGTVTVWSRKETSDDEASYNLTRASLDCKKKTVGILESSDYDETGKLAFKKRYDAVAAKKIIPGSTEDQLLGKMCK